MKSYLLSPNPLFVLPSAVWWSMRWYPGSPRCSLQSERWIRILGFTYFSNLRVRITRTRKKVSDSGFRIRFFFFLICYQKFAKCKVWLKLDPDPELDPDPFFLWRDPGSGSMQNGPDPHDCLQSCSWSLHCSLQYCCVCSCWAYKFINPPHHSYFFKASNRSLYIYPRSSD